MLLSVPVPQLDVLLSMPVCHIRVLLSVPVPERFVFNRKAVEATTKIGLAFLLFMMTLFLCPSLLSLFALFYVLYVLSLIHI